MPKKILCICVLCRAKNPSSIFVSYTTRTKHTKQERELLQWSNTQSTAVSASNQDIFGTATEQDDVESESMSATSMITSSEQYQELFDSDHSESEEGGEESEEDEANEIYEEEEEDMIEDEDLGKYSYDLIQMCTPNGYIFYIRIGNFRRFD
jgi:hypothetical protein